MTVIKRSTADQLRNGAPKGRKVMLIRDKACIDYRLCFKLKHTYGIYFITLSFRSSPALNLPPSDRRSAPPNIPLRKSQEREAISNPLASHELPSRRT